MQCDQILRNFATLEKISLKIWVISCCWATFTVVNGQILSKPSAHLITLTEIQLNESFTQRFIHTDAEPAVDEFVANLIPIAAVANVQWTLHWVASH